MNDKLYGLATTLSDEARKRDVGAFFKSIHGTLNHLLVGDSVWMGRFQGPVFVPSSLAQELHADFGELRRTWVDRLPTAAEVRQAVTPILARFAAMPAALEA